MRAQLGKTRGKQTTVAASDPISGLASPQELKERERWIRELQVRIQAGTYLVSADELAVCLLRSVPEWFAERAR